VHDPVSGPQLRIKSMVSTAYYRTVYGHNVVSAHIATAGIALGLRPGL
jgi:hypothetical protein